ncbi:MAG: carbamoyltransferase HypF [Anaerolineae bacterium]|nr:carbamoyltransferase HypF [Anaerolineae bacterium]
MQTRLRLRITGVVQGVGFRPFVYGLAQRYGLTGFVGNDSNGVFVEVQGTPESLDAFRSSLVTAAPPLAHIDSVAVTVLPVQHETTFVIVRSKSTASANTLISPDVAICADCLRELHDPLDRRYHYSFINCTHCGPRFTIITDIPYDRPLTTMAGFRMCAVCQAEYDDPLNRRFHAQPNACPLCGPQLWLEHAGQRIEKDVLGAAQALLVSGHIVAVKGLGGFHLACVAHEEGLLVQLRERKGRVDKPFAVMARDMAAVQRFAVVSAQEAHLLLSKERPIVLLRKREPSPLSRLVAPGNGHIGVMLPYTPLHELLLTEALPVLVMTSGNVADEPIVKDNGEARIRLAGLADALLMHDRPIHMHCDDSVVRMSGTELLPIRRSRGYAPFPVKLPWAVPPVLAVGGELKATFCITKEDYAFMSQHIGDMENWETLVAFEAAVDHFRHIFRMTPTLIAYDRHPGYLSARWAQQYAGDAAVVAVQHHHAHIASVMAENGHGDARPVIGFSFDGTGYGDDGAIWGGEVLLADYRGFERVSHLRYIPLPGGDAAIKRPYRTALAHLRAAGVDWDTALPPVAACSVVEQGVLAQQLETGLNCVPTSSFGRLFDAVAALAGVRQVVTYEAQAAIELEALAAPGITSRYTFALMDGFFDAAPVIREVATDVVAGVSAEIIAAKFHNAITDLIVNLSLQLRTQTGLNSVALSGGVFQNATLLKLVIAALEESDFDILTHRLVPPNDGGLALGQAMIAAQVYG